MVQFLSGLVALILTMAASLPAMAHEVRPLVATIDLSQPGRLSLDVAANLEAVLAGIGPEHADTDSSPAAADYNRMRALSPTDLEARFRAFAPTWLRNLGLAVDGARLAPTLESVQVPAGIDPKLARISRLTLAATLPNEARTLTWAYPPALGSSVLRVKRGAGVELETNWLKDGAAQADIPIAAPPPQSRLKTLVDYLVLGFTHILPKGLDHILFVLGLFFLSPSWRPLLAQVTAFTLAHSITLALGLYGVVEIAPSIVEPLIALSIVYVAVENLLTTKLTPWRPLVVFAFGLLHGLGFAGILQELGMPAGQYVTALVGFNVGVELGQLAVIALAWAATAYWFAHRPWYRARIVTPVCLAIALAGAFWTIERVWFT